ncbi:hypothetical protein ACSBR1_033980 [Camellia fascicularis]
MLNWWHLQGALPRSVENLLLWWAGEKMKKERLIWSAVPVVVMWSVWKLRNGVVFNASNPNWEELCELIKIRVALWLKPKFFDFHFTVHDF